MRYFHGGYPGLRPGDLIEPPDATGTERRLSPYVPSGAEHGMRTDVVYLATRRDAARCFAAFYPDGALYEAEPLGDPEPDPDAPDDAVMVDAARVRTVVDPVVLLRSRPPEAWLRMLHRNRQEAR